MHRTFTCNKLSLEMYFAWLGCNSIGRGKAIDCGTEVPPPLDSMVSAVETGSSVEFSSSIEFEEFDFSFFEHAKKVLKLNSMINFETIAIFYDLLLYCALI
jgi:hypothetical protein